MCSVPRRSRRHVMQGLSTSAHQNRRHRRCQRKFAIFYSAVIVRYSPCFYISIFFTTHFLLQNVYASVKIKLMTTMMTVTFYERPHKFLSTSHENNSLRLIFLDESTEMSLAKLPLT